MSRVVVKDQLEVCLGTGSARAALLALAFMLLSSSQYEFPHKVSIHARAGHYLLKSHIFVPRSRILSVAISIQISRVKSGKLFKAVSAFAAICQEICGSGKWRRTKRR
jgi:hypothetical protein